MAKEGMRMRNVTRITDVKRVARHCYDGLQMETAIYAKTEQSPYYRWYVAYGGNYLPATKADINNLYDIRPYDNEEEEIDLMGVNVYAYR